MKTTIDEIVIDGETYVPLHSIDVERECVKNNKFAMVRTYSAGVFAGYLKERDGKEVTLQDAIRIWYWKGANSLSQLAQKGTNKPSECKFAVPVDEVILTEVIEIITITKKAQKSIEGVTPWED